MNTQNVAGSGGFRSRSARAAGQGQQTDERCIWCDGQGVVAVPHPFGWEEHGTIHDKCARCNGTGQAKGKAVSKPPNTHHWTYSGALRARRQWLNSVRGRDAYVHKGGKRRYFVSYIDYQRPQRDPEQQALKDAHSHARDLSLCLDALGLVPDAQKYAHAINLAAHLTSALTAADAHRRFCEAEGIQRAFVPILGPLDAR